MKIFNIKYLILISLIFSFLLVGQISLARAEAQPQGAPGGFNVITERIKNIGEQPGFKGTKSFEETVGGVIKTALLLVGTIFLLLMVYGGYIWMTARGEEEEAKRAQNIITMAIIGIIVVLAAYAITYFIVYRLTATTGAGL